MSRPKSSSLPFAVTDCAMLPIATGAVAQNLRELGDRLVSIPSSSIYYHFWGAHLRPGFEEPEYNNDFALWAYEGLHDQRLAERLSVIDPAEFADMESLRAELIDTIEERLDESEYIPWAKSERKFHFARSVLVVFDTGMRLQRPEDLAEVLPQMSRSALYYHMIDARRRPPEGMDDFQAWLTDFGERYRPLIKRLQEIDPYFVTLSGLRDELTAAMAHFLAGRQDE